MFDQRKFEKLKDKEFRDAYLETHVRTRIAYQVRALREKLGMTQQQFGDLVGKTQSQISKLEDTEDGAATVQMLLDIASALKVALQIRFSSYPEFLEQSADVRPAALSVETIEESAARLARGTAYRIAATPDAGSIRTATGYIVSAGTSGSTAITYVTTGESLQWPDKSQMLPPSSPLRLSDLSPHVAAPRHTRTLTRTRAQSA